MSGNRLKDALEGARAQLEAGLAEAEEELAELDARRTELLLLIARANAALGVTPASATPSGRGLTLHAALAEVLRAGGNDWLTARELADEVNGLGLYRKRDGSPVEANEVHARTKNYTDLFEKDGSRIRLRTD
ncbi:MAG TPA: hypothetical protein VH416_08320 [Gaiellaceae bacterium]|jgi:hypothetical protein